MALLRLCSTPGCDELADGPRCRIHANARDAARGSSTDRGYDAEWQRVRKLVLDRDGHECQLRLRVCTKVATTVDHIVPLSAGGARLDMANLQAACRPCNTAKGGKHHQRPEWARGTR